MQPVLGSSSHEVDKVHYVAPTTSESVLHNSEELQICTQDGVAVLGARNHPVAARYRSSAAVNGVLVTSRHCMVYRALCRRTTQRYMHCARGSVARCWIKFRRYLLALAT